MSRFRTVAATGMLMVMGLSACATGSGEVARTVAEPLAVNVDVDTPELRSLRKSAGIEPCRPGRADQAPPDGLPDLALACLGGGPEVNLASLRGPLVVNLWATWCGPCREELPYYQRLHEEGRGKVRVLGINYQDSQPQGALELLAQTGVTFPSLADPGGELRGPLKVRGLPGLVLVDRDGAVRTTQYVVIRSYDQLRDLVAQHLDVRV